MILIAVIGEHGCKHHCSPLDRSVAFPILHHQSCFMKEGAGSCFSRVLPWKTEMRPELTSPVFMSLQRSKMPPDTVKLDTPSTILSVSLESRNNSHTPFRPLEKDSQVTENLKTPSRRGEERVWWIRSKITLVSTVTDQYWIQHYQVHFRTIVNMNKDSSMQIRTKNPSPNWSKKKAEIVKLALDQVNFKAKILTFMGIVKVSHCVNTHTHTCARTHACTRTCTNTSTYTHTCTHSHICTHMHRPEKQMH